MPCQQVNEAYQQVAFADKVHCSLFRIEKNMIRHVTRGISCWTWQIILNKLDLVTTEEAIKVKDLGYAVRKLAIGRQGCE